jgi:hypothetical protein
MANKDDNPTFKEAMAGPDAGRFITAMEAEIITLIELDGFEIVACTSNMKVLSGVSMSIEKEALSRWIHPQAQSKILCKRV